MSGFLDFLQGEESVRYGTKRKKGFEDGVSVIRPKNFNELKILLDSLKDNEGFIVDFENIEVSLAQRMLDFLCGAVYALEGRIEQLKNRMYMLLPKGLNIKTKLNSKG
ncbi:MAG: cell division protein SepF [Christensenellales bacterium]|mgnify:CR=1 FL=1|jgi:FtsZ-interacting cell division protein YlmF|nr:cell division protein SepF [Clostridiales bacterium]